jgi:HK97 family phage portal protein
MMRNKAAEILKRWIAEKSHAAGDQKRLKESFTLSDISDRHLPLFGDSGGRKDLRLNTAIEACGRFIRNAVIEARCVVKRPTADGDDQVIANHPLTEMLKSPNPFYLGSAMRSMIAWDLALTGTAYVFKTKTQGNSVMLTWLPSFAVEPIAPPLSRADKWIDYYRVTVGGATENIEPERVIQFRSGIDPNNQRKGYSQLRALLREVVTDNEATEYTYYVLANTGVPGMIVSPIDPEANAQALLENAPEIKRRLQDATTGSNRGEPVVLTYPLKIDVPSFSPDQMALDQIRDIPEERITAVLGIPAAVVGLGTGLQQTKVGATLKEMREEAYEGGILPLLAIMAETWTVRLLPDFNNASGDYVHYDVSHIKVFQEDENSKHQRVRDDWRAGLLTLAQALTALGMKPEPGDERLRVFDLTIGRFDARDPLASEKMAAMQRVKRRQELIDALQLTMNYESEANGSTRLPA